MSWRSSSASALVAVAMLVPACSGSAPAPERTATPSTPTGTSPPSPQPSAPATAGAALPGMPPVPSKRNLYADAGAGMLSKQVSGQRSLVYVPNLSSGTVTVIDPKRFRVIGTFTVGTGPQHVVPSYDLQTLWVNNSISNSLTPINPRTGKPGKSISVADPYNLYFTPDGKYAVVMAERERAIDFRRPHSMKLVHRLATPNCQGVNHADFSANGRYFVATCEFNGRLIKVDTLRQKVVGEIDLGPSAMPQDVKLSPDGKVFYIADMMADGLQIVIGKPFRKIGFIATGAGTHGLYASRDGRFLYASNRDEGSVSVLRFATRKVVAKWRIPGGGSPDMGNVSVDGKVLWLSGRRDDVVYAFNTRNGRLLAKIPVGNEPHGLCVWPQPGRYSLGHTGVTR